jgi:hypothetical protein
MKVRSKFIQSSTKSWDMMFHEAADFASKLPATARLINISHSCDSGTGVVCVWYAVPDDNEDEDSAF